MPFTAPWLQGTDAVGAMRSGAQLGLEARGQDLNELEAGDRLKLAYTHLAQQERDATLLAQSKLAQNNAALQLRAQQSDLMAQFHQQALEQAKERSDALSDQSQARLEATQQHSGDMLDLAQQRLDLAKEGALAKGAPYVHEQGVGIYERDPDTGQWSQTATFPAKAPKYGAKRVKVGMDGTVTDLTGDPDDPTVKQFIEEHQAQAAWVAAGHTGPAPKPAAAPAADELRTGMGLLPSIQQSATPFPSSPIGPLPAAPAATGEVIRVTSDGRSAVFDAASKKFLRYADDPPSSD